MITPELIKKVKQEIKRSVSSDYFFEKLTSPEWIQPLKKEGFFKNPPPPIRERDLIRFPVWAESRYLAKMAPLDPELVLNTIKDISKTDNIRVFEDMVDAALGMPPSLAAKLLPILSEKQENDPLGVYSHKLGDLMVHLGKGGQEKPALTLGEFLIGCKETDGEVNSNIDQYEFEEILKEKYPLLVSKFRWKAIEIISKTLLKAMKIENEELQESNRDISYIWQPAIEDNPQNKGYFEIKRALATAFRNALVYVCKQNHNEINTAIEFLEKYSILLYKRIILFLINEFSDHRPDLVKTVMFNNEPFDDLNTWHEYAVLFKNNFHKLEKADQDYIFYHIIKKSGLEDYKLLCRLILIKDHIDEEPRKLLNDLLEKLGEPDHPEFLYYSSGVWRGPQSPKRMEELSLMPLDQMINYLKTWTPPENKFMAPSPEGLGRELQMLAKDKIEEYSKNATSFKELDATYVRGLILGFTVGLDSKEIIFHWIEVLNLCEWAVNQEPFAGKGEYKGQDPHWGWARKEIAHLFQKGFKDNSTNGIPFSLREKTWQILRIILRDPDPNKDDEEKYSTAWDYNGVAINSTRSEALLSVLDYALWVKRNLNLSDWSNTFSSMAEVQETLEYHLNIENEPCFSIRTIYGKFFPWIFYLDQDWTINNLENIFPKDENQENYCNVAWDSYVIFNNPNERIFNHLKSEYERAINKITSRVEINEDDDLRPDIKLGEHLLVFYFWELIDVPPSEKNLFEKYFNTADIKLTSNIIQSVGRLFKDSKDELTKDSIIRLKNLWEWRFEKTSKNPSLFGKEIAAFGWWAYCGIFPKDWILDQLVNVLKITKYVEPEFSIYEGLIDLFDVNPVKTLECLKLLIDGLRNDRWFYLEKKEIHQILKMGMQDSRSKSKTEDIINILGAKGFRDFRELLK